MIWRLGRWIARREDGTIRLRWAGGELHLGLRDGRVRTLIGPDSSEVARRLEAEAWGAEDLLREAAAIAETTAIDETRAVAAAKEVLEEKIGEWIADPNRELDIDDEVPDEDGPSISLAHAVVELVLSGGDDDLLGQVLPETDVLLRRSPDFLDLYAPLRLSEEADLIVAKITGQRTAREIAVRSPHGSDEVLRLLAALVATGMLEPVPVATPEESGELLRTELPEEPEDGGTRRRWVGWAIAALVVVVVVIGGLWLATTRFGAEAGTGDETGEWGVAVDMGCQSEELQRVLRMARENPRDLRPIAVEAEDGETCWRLVWGSFESRGAAEEGIEGVPDSLRREGFEPHVVKVDGGSAAEPPP